MGVIILVTFMILVMYLVAKLLSPSINKHSKYYVKKMDFIEIIIKFILVLLITVIWITLINKAFDSNTANIINNALKDGTHSNDGFILLITTSSILISFVNAAVIYKTCNYIYWIIKLLLRHRSQKKPTVENQFLESLNNGTDAEIVKNYNMRKSLQYSENVKLSENDKNKLISALMNESKYEDAKHLAKRNVEKNRKLIKRKKAIMPLQPRNHQ